MELPPVRLMPVLDGTVSEEPDKTEGDQDVPARSLKKKLLIAVAGVLLLVGAAVAVLLPDSEVLPSDSLQAALRTVDEAAAPWQAREALKTVDGLAAIEYVDPEFPAAIPWIRGMVAFLEAQDITGDERVPRYLEAIDQFEIALPRGMPLERRQRMGWALGVSLQLVGLSTSARPHLEESLQNYEPGRVQASLLLIQNYIDQPNKADLERALALIEALQTEGQLEPARAETLVLQKAQTLHLLGRATEAEQALSDSSSGEGGEHETIVLRARTMMSEAGELATQGALDRAKARYQEAREVLKPLLLQGVPAGAAARGLYLSGICYDAIDDADSAIAAWQKVVRMFPESDEAFAALLRHAGLLRRKGRDEEALTEWRRALRQVLRPEEFRNRWMTIELVRQTVLAEWKAWLESNNFEEAIELARAAPPLLSNIRSLELIAEVSQRWAENLQNEWEQATFDRKNGLLGPLRQRWTASGKVWRDLATLIRSEARYPEVIWTSALHFTQGYEFETALALTDEFIRNKPTEGMVRARVHRARVLTHLDRLTEALTELQSVIRETPTDPFVFEARFLIGQTQLELDQPDEAAKTWESLLTLSDLAPTADEWRRAKFALGKLLAETAADDYRKTVPREDIAPNDDQLKRRATAFQRWREAIRHLDEYLRRYPESPENTEARYLLARSLQAAAREPRQKLTAVMPSNARAELYRDINGMLGRAVTEYRLLQQELQERRVKAQLDDFGQELYRATFLEIPHTLFEQEQYSDALLAYRTVTSRFPEQVSVLIASVQMARCYDRLDKPDEARRQLEQARIILQQLPDAAFESRSTAMTRQQWSDWIDWARQAHDGQLNRSLAAKPAT